MTARSLAIAAAAVAALAAAAWGGYWFAGRQATTAAHSGHDAPAAAPAPQERQVLYWHDPMYPQQKFDKPGRSPFMDMDLVPVYADESGGSSVNIDPALAQSLGMRTALAETGTFWRRVDTVGTVQADERRINVLQSRAAGWLEKLHVRAVSDPVSRGTAVAEIYAPDLLAAQEEYLLLEHTEGRDSELAMAARQRLSLLGLSAAQIGALQATGEAQRRIVLHSPSAGIVTEIGAREGAAVTPGMTVAAIVDLARVWIVAEVPEMQLSWIANGRPVEATVAALPGELYEGKVEYIYPDIDPQTRTAKVRFSVNNPGLRLRPGMVASVTIFGGAKREVLLVPAEAVIRTGTRTVVIVEEAAGRFRAQEVRTGLASGDRVEIAAGLAAGERVVVSGQFLIDSEANLRGAINRLSTATGGDAHGVHGATSAAPVEHVAEGTVKEVDAASGRLVIAHGPVATLDWPSMTMGFSVADAALLQSLKPGQRIEFRFVDADAGYQVTGATVQPGKGAP
jgi:membrane fusion protein, copper/silver efflux system